MEPVKPCNIIILAWPDCSPESHLIFQRNFPIFGSTFGRTRSRLIGNQISATYNLDELTLSSI